MLKDLRLTLPKLVHAIDESVRKLSEYLAISRTTKIYVLAMCRYFFNCVFNIQSNSLIYIVLNPAYKLKWIDENWSSSDAKAARESVKDSVSLHPSFWAKIIN